MNKIKLLLLIALSTTWLGCATTTTTVVEPAPTIANDHADDQESSELVATLRADLDRASKRESDATAARSERAAASRPSSPEITARMAEPVTSLAMPIAGFTASRISDSWGDPRDGGKRRHRGIDLFAPRGTAVVAVMDGRISYIGEQPKGGRCLWLTTDRGVSLYYAHLDRWAPGLTEGQDVQKGDLLGFVGNTGNAINTPSHLHFSVVQDDEGVNPYPLLKAYSGTALWPRPILGGGFTAAASSRR